MTAAALKELQNHERIDGAIQLLKSRAGTMKDLASSVIELYTLLEPSRELMEKHVTQNRLPALRDLRNRLVHLGNWDRGDISAAMKAVVKEHGLKMPDVAMPMRVLVKGKEETPSVDALLEVLGRDKVIDRLSTHLKD
jgi:glutamyl-tRNA synthetase